MRIEDLRVGDIVIYRHKGINMVNKPHKYCQWYGDDFKHRKWGKWSDIMKVQRYEKFLWFYRLKTIYERVEE